MEFTDGKRKGKGIVIDISGLDGKLEVTHEAGRKGYGRTIPSKCPNWTMSL
jgi:hypothetical protein